MSTTTTFMGLIIPDVNVTPGPAWATLINNAMEAVDAHDHSTGSGRKITPNGLNINSALNVNDNRIYTINHLSMSALSSDPTNNRSIYVKGADLYYRDSAGNNVRVTNSGALDISAVGGIGGDYSSSGASVIYSTLTSKYSFYTPAAVPANIIVGGIDIDPAGSKQITGDVSLTGLVTFVQNTTMSQDLAVTGNTALTGTLTVGGATTLSGALNVTGIVTLSSNVSTSGNLTVGGTVTGSGLLTINNSGILKGDLTLGSNATATSNIKLRRGGTGILQVALGDDVTTEGTSSTTLGQLSFNLESIPTTSLPPANSNEGRILYDSTSKSAKISNGLEFIDIFKRAGQDIALANWSTGSIASTAGVWSLAGSCYSTYGTIHVAVGSNSTGTSLKRAMTSSDGGENWVEATTPTDNSFAAVASVADSNTVYLMAVATSGTGDRWMRQGGSGWTTVTGSSDISWSDITGIIAENASGASVGWVAVASTGTGQRAATCTTTGTVVMRTTADMTWRAVASNKLTGASNIIVAVASAGTSGNNGRAMYSVDKGVTWTQVLTADDTKAWGAVCWDGTKFVATTLTGDYTMTSSNGTAWSNLTATSVSLGVSNIAYGNGVYCIFGLSNTFLPTVGLRVIAATSNDLVSWTYRFSNNPNTSSVGKGCYGKGCFLVPLTGSSHGTGVVRKTLRF